MISEHSAHSTPQPFGIRTWLWRYTSLLLLISMLWHRQAIFESKGDKLSLCAMLATFVAAGSCASSLETHNGVAFFVLIQVILAWTCNNILQLVKAGSVFNFDLIIYSLTVLHCFSNNYTAIQQAAWEQHENCDLMLREFCWVSV